jgi:hypothetical protein
MRLLQMKKAILFAVVLMVVTYNTNALSAPVNSNATVRSRTVNKVIPVRKTPKRIKTAPKSRTTTSKLPSKRSTGRSSTISHQTMHSPSVVKCTFKYVLPTTSNLASELERVNYKQTFPSTGSGSGSGTGLLDNTISDGSGNGSIDKGNNINSPTLVNQDISTPPQSNSSSISFSTIKKDASIPQVISKPTTVKAKAPSIGNIPQQRQRQARRTEEEAVALDVTPTIDSVDPVGGSINTATATDSSSIITSTTPSNSLMGGDPSFVQGEFSCDQKFYSAWKQMGLFCAGEELNISKAVQAASCVIYAGTKLTNVAACLSICKFPACNETSGWSYESENGIDSLIYQNLDLLQLLRFGGVANTKAKVAPATTTSRLLPLPLEASQHFSNVTFKSSNQCAFEDESSFFKSCECPRLLGSTSSPTSAAISSLVQDPKTLAPTPILYTVPIDKGMGDFNHWADGRPKTTLDKLGITTTSLGGSAVGVSVAVSGAMSITGGVLGSTSAAGGIATAGASSALALAAIDLCQFSVMINQLNLDARPRMLEEMGKRMAPSIFTFLPFGKVASTNQNETHTTKRFLLDEKENEEEEKEKKIQGMKRYAKLIGIQVDQLFYVTLAGVILMFVVVFICYLLFMAICFVIFFCVCVPQKKVNFSKFATKCFDKVIGLFMMIAILSEYAIGVTATFHFCYCIETNQQFTFGHFVSLFVFLLIGLGTIVFGLWIIKKNEQEIQDLGTKKHLKKRIYTRYGVLYDEYKYENRFFFGPKLVLVLGCGMITGMLWISGTTQLICLISLHILFLFCMEFKQPYPTKFIQKASSLVVFMKISTLFLSFCLIYSNSKVIPLELRQAIGFVIIGLQVLVLICLCVRQIYIFYRTWKLKRQKEEEEIEEEIDEEIEKEEEKKQKQFDFFPLPSLKVPITTSSTTRTIQRDDSIPILDDPHRRYE